MKLCSTAYSCEKPISYLKKKEIKKNTRYYIFNIFFYIKYELLGIHKRIVKVKTSLFKLSSNDAI